MQGATPPPTEAAPAGGTMVIPKDMDGIKALLYNNAPLLTSYAVRVIGVILILFIAWLIAMWVGRALTRALTKARLDTTLARFFGKIARWAILIFALLACLGAFGIDVTSFAVVLGAAGLAIGLAFQGSLSNLAAGVMLLIFRPFKIGDVVTVSGQTGIIFEIDLFATIMDTFDNRRLILPNADVFGSVIENVTFHSERRVEVPVGIAYDVDIDQTREVLMKAAQSVEGRSETRDVQVVLLELGGSSVNWSVRIWVPTANFFPLKEALIRAVKVSLDEADITIPFPQMDVHLDGLELAQPGAT